MDPWADAAVALVSAAGGEMRLDKVGKEKEAGVRRGGALLLRMRPRPPRNALTFSLAFLSPIL